MHPNYRFLIEKITAENGTARVLDFGCGSGHFVKSACDSGLDCYGADVFYDGIGRKEAEESGLLGTRLKEIAEGKLPFPDNHFDVVVSNYVFEHVQDLQFALGEIHRTLRPGGTLLALFPTRETIREGHVNMPWVHRLKPGLFRECYVLALRQLGFGEKDFCRTPREWVDFKLQFLDRLTFYRTHKEICHLVLGAGFSLRFIENDYMHFRLRRRIPFAQRISRLFGATVVSAIKPGYLNS